MLLAPSGVQVLSVSGKVLLAAKPLNETWNRIILTKSHYDAVQKSSVNT